MKTRCDECDNVFEQGDLINITPQVTEEMHDLKDGYEEFDGMVCESCYEKISI